MYPSNSVPGLKRSRVVGRKLGLSDLLASRCLPAFRFARWRWALVSHWRMSAPLRRPGIAADLVARQRSAAHRPVWNFA
jgi:hypothetical protein